MSITREQMISALQGELDRRKRLKALPQSMENIKKDQEGYKASNDVDPNLQMGLLSGARRGALGAVNLLTSNPKFARGVPDFASNERLREIDKQDKDLRATGGGMVGGLAGEVLTTGPIGGGTGKVMTKLPQALKYLTSLPARSTAEGAITSAVVADPDRRGEAATEGGGAGALLGSAGVAGKRIVKGLVEKSQAAEDLITHGITEGKKLFIPLGQATQRGANEPKAGVLTRTLGAAYRGLLPYFPGAGEQIERQAGRLNSDVSEMAIKSVDRALDPAGVGTLPDDVLRDPQRAVKEMGDKIRTSYKNTVKSYAFQFPSDIEQQVRARIRQARPDVPQSIEDDYTQEFLELAKTYSDKSGVITGNNMMEIKNLFGGKVRDRAPTVNDKAMVDEVHNLFDDIVETQLRQGGKASNLADLAEYKRTRDAWHKFAALERTVNAKGPQRAGGQFKAADLIDNAGTNVDQRQLGQTANAVTGKKAISVSAEGRNLGRVTGALGTGALWGTAGLPGLATAATVLGGANVAATETAQKLLMGDTKTQQFIIQMLRKDPELAQQVGSIIRAGVTTAVGDSNKVTE